MRWYIIIIVILVIIIVNKKRLNMVWNDYWTNRRIKELHPVIRDRVNAFIQAAAKEGILLRITTGYRPPDEQQTLYNKGRDENGIIIEPKKVVTWAEPWLSYHQYRLAFDVVIMDNGTTPNWNYNDPRWATVGKLGKKYGFIWGGDWSGKKKDRPHFQDPRYTIAQLYKKYQNGDMTNGYINYA